MQKGDELILLKPIGTDSTDAALSFVSPCDCIIRAVLVMDDMNVQEGKTLLKLIPHNETPSIIVSAEAATVNKSRIGGQASFRLSGEDEYRSGRISAYKKALPDSERIQMMITPDKNLKAQDIGKPAEVVVHLSSRN